MLLCVFSHVSNPSNSFLQLHCYQFPLTVPSGTMEIDVIVSGLKKLQKIQLQTDIIYVLMQLLGSSLSLIVCKYTCISNGTLSIMEEWMNE